MKKVVILFLLSVFYFGFTAQTQHTEIVKLEKLQKLIGAKSEKIQIINFWATWCSPCIKELPLLEKLNAEARPNITVTLVSMDLDLDPNPERVYKFIARKKIQADVLILDEKDPNSWINKIEKNWSGALPATILINQKNGKRRFVEKELQEGDLERLLLEIE